MNGKTCAKLMLSASSVLFLTPGCGDDEMGPSQPVDPTGEVAPAFDLTDANPNSGTYDQTVSPRDYLLQVSAWYFSHST